MAEFITIQRILLRSAGAGVLLFGLIYAGDYLSLRLRIPPSRAQFGMVRVQSHYEIHEKNGKTEYDYNPPAPVTCVNSLFSHLGYQPCWYLRRHPEQKIEI